MDPNLLSEAELQALLQEEAPEEEHDEVPEHDEAAEHDEAGGHDEVPEHGEEPPTLPAHLPPDKTQSTEELAEVAELKEIVRQLQIRMAFLEQLLQGHLKEANAGVRGSGAADAAGQTRKGSGAILTSSQTSVPDGKASVGLPPRKIRHARRGGQN